METNPPKTRAGVLLAREGRWFREVPQEFQEERSERVCKTILFKRKDGKRIATLVPYHSRVSYKKLKKHLGQDVRTLSPDEVRAEGFEPHECAPMLVTCELFVDPACLTKRPIQTGSGTLGTSIEWHIEDLAAIRPYGTLDVKEERESTTKSKSVL